MCLLQEADKHGYMMEYVHILANDTEYVTKKKKLRKIDMKMWESAKAKSIIQLNIRTFLHLGE